MQGIDERTYLVPQLPCVASMSYTGQMPTWQVAGCRLTVFVAPDTVVPATLWRDTVGEDPETTTTQRSAGVRVEKGSFGNGNLTLTVQPMRIDWGYDPLPALSTSVDVLGDFPAAADPLLIFAKRWVRDGWYPITTRIALGLVLISPTTDRKTGYEELSRFVDGVPSAVDATDFLYQVNRPRPSSAGLAGLRVNRLAKWAVAGLRLVALAGGPQNSMSAESYNVHLELDINTNPDYGVQIPRESVELVIDDLFAAAREVAEQGSRG